ncbi:sialin-like [Schistocerca piceifrons]|uniref:sialin-like n=1 Tax=Schistocerca piceifrons TaxID=274613 RepID=UPI001F5F0A40|nr:sialin-like [Schistocerca piceifrons]
MCTSPPYLLAPQDQVSVQIKTSGRRSRCSRVNGAVGSRTSAPCRGAAQGHKGTAAMATTPQDSSGLWKTRYTMALLCLLGLTSSLTTRVNLSVAIVDMVNETAVLERDSNGSARPFIDPDACPGELAVRGSGGRKDGDFTWDKQKQGELLAAFYYGYVIGHVPGGMLADYFGGKIVFAVSVFVSSLLSVLSPASAWAGDYVLFANRVTQGLVQGGIIPTIQTLICRWAPDHERSKFSIIFLGQYVGTVLSMAATGALCATSLRWPLTFYVFGGVGLLWCLPWWLLASDSPAQHTNIDPDERRYIEATIQSSAKQKLPVPWRSLLSTPAIWALVAYFVTYDCTFYLFLSSLPLYIADILHFDVESFTCTATLHAVSSSWQKSGASYSGLLHAGLLVPAVALVAVALVGCDSAAIVAMLALSGFCMASHCTGIYMNMQAIAPNYAGTIVGFVNTFANISGIIVPYIVGAVTNANPTRATWNMVFYMAAAVLVAGYVLYAVFTTSEEQPWNVPPTENGFSVKNDKGIVNTTFHGDDSQRNS